MTGIDQGNAEFFRQTGVVVFDITGHQDIGTLAMSSAFAQIPPPPDPDDILSEAYTGKSYSPYANR